MSCVSKRSVGSLSEATRSLAFLCWEGFRMSSRSSSTAPGLRVVCFLMSLLR